MRIATRRACHGRARPCETRPVPDPTSAEPEDPIAEERSQWLRLVGDDAVMTALLRRHRERHRRYHTAGHVLAVVHHVDDLAAVEPVDDLGAIIAAAWFHDAVYEPQSPANERASARLARRDLIKLGWSSERADTVSTMIEGTSHHTDPADIDTAVLFDADLAILGAAPDTYSAYVADVRAEYAHMDDESWLSGRADVLDAFLDRDRIYATATGFDRWESAARSNIAAEREALRR
jgi:predicted metal-dependent HD superfamily phosphohydrolase